MTMRLHWSDAQDAVAVLRSRPSDRHTLIALAHFPLASASLLEGLFDLHRTASHRSLARLQEAELVAAIRPPLSPGCSPQRWYLTDLGLATLALDRNVELLALASHFHLRGADLLQLLPALPQLAALYALLGALAASGPEQPDLLAWRRPWRCRFQPLTTKTPVSVSLPAYVAFDWDGAAGGFLLLPDRGDLPLAVYRSTLGQLYALQRFRSLPTLLIATPGSARARAWHAFLEDVRSNRNASPLPAYVIPWHDLPTGDQRLLAGTGNVSAAALAQSLSLPALHPRRASCPLPRLVGAALTPRAGAPRGAPLGHAALRLSPADRELLLLVGRHPFLPPAGMAMVLDWTVKAVRHRRSHLRALGLLRLVETMEIGERAGLELAELTVDGMDVLAAGQGLSLARAVACHGLTGGGPKEPIGARQALLANLAHTLGTDAVFVRLYQTARRLAALGTDDALLEWQNGTACSRRHLRPDGYGRYRRHGYSYGFYVEYDRGTMSAKGYWHKFRAYYDDWQRRRFYRNEYHFPAVLFVTVSEAAEERIARVARIVARGQYAPLPLLLTGLRRIDDPSNPGGLLGPIWREPDASVEDRRRWIEDKE